jgi:hypothetical protein
VAGEFVIIILDCRFRDQMASKKLDVSTDVAHPKEWGSACGVLPIEHHFVLRKVLVARAKKENTPDVRMQLVCKPGQKIQKLCFVFNMELYQDLQTALDKQAPKKRKVPSSVNTQAKKQRTTASKQAK